METKVYKGKVIVVTGSGRGTANEFVNGSNITIDGGMTKKMIYEP